MVISQLMFRKYLDNCTNPVEAAAASRLPSAGALPVQLRDGECDLMIIHRQQGLIVGEIKSVGGGSYFKTQPQSQQHGVIVKKVDAAVRQVNNQETALRHLVSDLNINVSNTIIFPNLTSAQLLQSLTNSPVAQVSVSMSVLFANISDYALINTPVAQVSVSMSVLFANLLDHALISMSVAQVSVSMSVLFANPFYHAHISMPMAQLGVFKSVPSARLLLALTTNTAGHR